MSDKLEKAPTLDELPPSNLGTKEHWDEVYGIELQNFKDIGAEGEVWFGEESINKIVEWVQDNLPMSPRPSILEIGSGNGTLLLSLAEELNPAPYLYGIDYSFDAVALSKAIAAERGGSAEDIVFDVCDFLNEDVAVPTSDNEASVRRWDLVLDKGTLDAIALGNKDEQGRSPAWNYPSRLARILQPGSMFLVTSCNFTEDELRTQFITVETGLVFHSRIQHRTFTFGGQKGNVVSSLAFQRPV